MRDALLLLMGVAAGFVAQALTGLLQDRRVQRREHEQWLRAAAWQEAEPLVKMIAELSSSIRASIYNELVKHGYYDDVLVMMTEIRRQAAVLGILLPRDQAAELDRLIREAMEQVYAVEGAGSQQIGHYSFLDGLLENIEEHVSHQFVATGTDPYLRRSDFREQ